VTEQKIEQEIQLIKERLGALETRVRQDEVARDEFNQPLAAFQAYLRSKYPEAKP